MFIYSIKAQSLKLYLSIALSVLSVIFVVAFLPPRDIHSGAASVEASKDISERNFKNVETVDDHVAFLKQFGWEIDPEAREITQVTIPVQFNEVYENYNELQRKEGLDLEKYKGKTVKKYTYLVNNHNYDGVVYANLLIYKNQVIGGDLCSAVSGGFIHGFTDEKHSQN